MTRKQWLTAFLRLADTDAPAISYRKQLKIKTNSLPRHVKSIGKYREELASLKKEEVDSERAREKAERDAKAREGRDTTRELAKRERQRRIDSTVLGTGFTTTSDEETVGPREDNPED